MEQGLRRRIEPHGVVPGQFAALLALYEQDGLTQAELCRRVRIEQPTMAHTLRRMERDGLIRREVDPLDGRRVAVRLSGRAKEVRHQLVADATEVNANALRGLNESEAATLMSLLGRAIGNMVVALSGADAPSPTPGRADPS